LETLDLGQLAFFLRRQWNVKMKPFLQKNLILKSKNIILCEAEPKDAPAMLEFLGQVSDETPYTYNYPGQKLKLENQELRIANEQKSLNSIRLFAFDDGKLIGQIGLWKLNPDHPWLKHKAEFAMMIIKEWWGSGLAKALLNEIDTFARSIEVTRIEATVSCSNERGVALYKKHGYVIEGTAKAYKIVDGEPLDSYFIAKHV
jgi:RimJ/RimL family protein N-acetyltransferase